MPHTAPCQRPSQMDAGRIPPSLMEGFRAAHERIGRNGRCHRLGDRASILAHIASCDEGGKHVAEDLAVHTCRVTVVRLIARLIGWRRSANDEHDCRQQDHAEQQHQALKRGVLSLGLMRLAAVHVLAMRGAKGRVYVCTSPLGIGRSPYRSREMPAPLAWQQQAGQRTC